MPRGLPQRQRTGRLHPSGDRRPFPHRGGGLPRGPSPGRQADQDLANFKRKVEAGANGAITQYFYNPDAYFGFIDRCTAWGIHIPILPGIMPITNFSQLARFSDACGAEIPRWVRKRLEAMGDDIAAIRAFGHEVVLGLCRRLLDGGAPGLHFYSMNQAGSGAAAMARPELARQGAGCDLSPPPGSGSAVEITNRCEFSSTGQGNRWYFDAGGPSTPPCRPLQFSGAAGFLFSALRRRDCVDD